MKQEENLKTSPMLKNGNDLRARSHSPKAYLGCDTCKMKNSEIVKKVKSISKLSDYGMFQDRNKTKKVFLEKDKEIKKPKIKLTDLCEEDKKRIVDLIEELSKFAERNQQMKEALDRMENRRQEQQEYIMKQANSYFNEKNFYLNEINEYKIKAEVAENELKTKMSQWESHERFMDTEIAYLAKALQKSLKEKNELNEQLNHLKICLRQSLESFQRLRAGVGELQLQERMNKKYKTVSSQTDSKIQKEKYKLSDDDSEEEFMSTCNQDTIAAKSSLDIINDKLEHVYQLLKRRSESLNKQHNLQKIDLDLSKLLKNDQLLKEYAEEDLRFIEENSPPENEENAAEKKFLKPFDQCSKTSIQAERILKKFGKPLNLSVNECSQKTENNKTSNKVKDSSGDFDTLASTILQKRIIQKNNIFQSSEYHECEEDRLLEELFYPDQNLNFGIDPLLKLENEEPRTTIFNTPFT